MLALRWSARLLGLFSVLVLARLLAPTDFGLVAIATLFVSLLDVLFAFGLENALVQQRDTTDEDLNTAWTLQVIQKSLIALGVLALSAPAEEYFNEPRLPETMYVIAAITFAQGFRNIGVVRFIKELDFRAQFGFEIAPRIMQVIVAIAAGVALRSYWALIAGLIVGALTSVVVSYAIVTYRPRFSLLGIKRLWSFSAWSMLLSLGNFLLYRAEEGIVGANGRTHQLGVYNMASELAQLPSTELMAPLNRVLFPAYAKLQQDIPRLREAFLRGLHGIALLLCPAAVGCAVLSFDLVPVLLGDQWLESSPLMIGLACYGLLRGLFITNNPALIASGNISFIAKLAGGLGLVTLPAAYVALNHIGIAGVIGAKVLVMSLGLAVSYYKVCRILNCRRRAIGVALLSPMVASVAMGGIVLFATAQFTSHLARLAVGIPTGVLAYACFVLLLWLAAGKPQGIESELLARVSIRAV